MRGAVSLLSICMALSALAIDVGTFDDSRVATGYGIQTGVYYGMLNAAWEAQGAVWHETGTLTPGFLRGVEVFLTSYPNGTPANSIEQAALASWVKGGGTLVVFGDCS